MGIKGILAIIIILFLILKVTGLESEISLSGFAQAGDLKAKSVPVVGSLDPTKVFGGIDEVMAVVVEFLKKIITYAFVAKIIFDFVYQAPLLLTREGAAFTTEPANKAIARFLGFTFLSLIPGYYALGTILSNAKIFELPFYSNIAAFVKGLVPQSMSSYAVGTEAITLPLIFVLVSVSLLTAVLKAK